MRTTAEKTGKKIIYGLAAVAVLLYMLLLGDNTLISHAANVTMITNAKVRSEASTDSDVIGSAASGETFSVAAEVTGDDGKTWYQISLNGSTGYIRADLAEEGGTSSDVQAEVEEENAYTETSGTISETNVISATVTTSSANVRKGPSSSDAAVTSVKSGTQVTVTGETTGSDGNMWYQIEVDGKTGYIRSDLVEPDAYADESDDEDSDEEDGDEDSDSYDEDGLGDTTVVRVLSSKIIPDGTDLEDMTADEATLEEWADGNYYVLYTQDADGGDGWYLYSISDGQFEKIASLDSDDEDGDGSGIASLMSGGRSMIVIAIVVVLVVVLILVCLLMAFKLHSYREYEYYGDEDEEDDDDDEEEEEDEDEDEEDEEDDDEDDDEEEDDRRYRRSVKKSKWGPKNFLSRTEDDDDEDEDEEDEEDGDGEEGYLDDDDFEFEFLNMDEKDTF